MKNENIISNACIYVSKISDHLPVFISLQHEKVSGRIAPNTDISETHQQKTTKSI